MYNRQLDTFLQVVKTGSFTKAADMMLLSTVSVMKQINQLESRVGVKLFERTRRGVFLTEAGNSFYEDAKQIISQCTQAIERARNTSVKEKKIIKVGTSFLRPCNLLTELWKKIDDGSYPFQIHLVPFGDSPQEFDQVLKSLGTEIDCFVSPCDLYEWRENYTLLKLEDLKGTIVLPKTHRLAKKKELTFEDIDGEKLIILSEGLTPNNDRLRNRILERCSSSTIIDIPTLFDLNAFNLCDKEGCLMSSLGCWENVHPDLLTIPFTGHMTIPYGIVAAKHPSKECLTFLELIAESVPDSHFLDSSEFSA